MDRRLFGLATAVSTLFCAPVFAQPADFAVWTQAGARILLGERTRLDAFQNVRFDEDVGRFAMSAPELALSVRLVDGVSVRAGYRLGSHREDDLTWYTKHRFAAGMQFGAAVGHLGAGARVLLVEDLTPGATLEDQLAVRTRAHVAWEQWEWTPTGSVEVFNNLFGDGELGHGEWRLTFGPRLNFGRHHVELFYRLRKKFPDADATDHIAGLGYRIDIE